VFTGLGNPGRRFLFNRHNIGFMVIDYACSQLSITKTVQAHKMLIMHTRVENNEIMMIKPLTYMNKSGQAIKQFASAYGIAPQEFVIIYDDLYLPLGKIRIRPRGGSGGHNGMESIITTMQTTEIPRIRIGTKEVEVILSETYSDYVLANFSKSELDIVHDTLECVYDSMVCITQNGLHTSMNKFNKK